MEYRRESEQETGEKRDEAGEGQHASVHCNLSGARQVSRKVMYENGNASVEKGQCEKIAGSGKYQAFSHQLARNAGLTGAKRCAESNFTGARRGTREQQVADVGARDQQ